MTASEQQAMRDYHLQSDDEKIWRGITRNFTLSNVTTLVIWLLWTGYNGGIDLITWLKIFAVTASVFYAGWISDKIWWKRFGLSNELPFSARAYLSRLPVYFVFGGIFFGITLLLIRVLEPAEVTLFLFVGGTIELLIQIPVQWALFNRLRKLTLTNL